MTSLALAATDGQNHDRLNDAGTPIGAPILISSAATPGDHDISAWQKMLSATSGSLLTSLLVTPLDVVRVRWQSQNVQQPVVDFSKLARTTNNLNGLGSSNLGVTACCREVFFMNNNAEYCIVTPKAGAAEALGPADCAVQEAQKKSISSTLDGLRKIARNEGFTSLWRGLSPTLVMAVPANMIYFTGYDWLRYNPQSPIAHRFKDDSAPLVAGSVARVLAVTAVSPMEMFKTRMQATEAPSTTGSLANAFRDVRDMIDMHGYRSLWRGLSLTLWRDVPFSGIYWWGYETVRGRLTDWRDSNRGRTLEARGSRTQSRRRSQSQEKHSETFTDSFTAGAISGAVASIVTMPFDVGKTRTQVFRDAPRQAVTQGAVKAGAAPEEGSMGRLLWHIFRTEGVAGLWRGWIPRTLKVAPACAIMISSYEVGKRVFRGMNERSIRQMSDTD